jgi:tetratricopeptide (TPR) repeat protein
MKSVSALLFLLICGLNSFSFAQDADKIKAAFNLSIEEEAAKNYDRAIQSMMQVYSENSYEVNMRLGWLTYINAKYDESINYYKKAVKLKPMSTEALWGLASPLSMKQKWVELNDTYLAIIKNDPKNSLANYYVGLFYYSDKNYAKAKSYFDVSLELNPMDSEVCRMSAWTNYFLKNKDVALALFNRVLMLNHTNSSALEGLTLAKKL